MDFIDFFFPEQAQAAHLRRIAARGQFTSAARPVSAGRSEEVAALRADVEFLALVLSTILKRLAETETLSLADVRDLLDETDGLDGVADGGLDVGVLRGLLGVLKEDHGATAEEEELQAIADLHRRYRR